jgi:hypothetical protein
MSGLNRKLQGVLGSDTVSRLFGRHYCSIPYVQVEVAHLAGQLAAMKKKRKRT